MKPEPPKMVTSLGISRISVIAGSGSAAGWMSLHSRFYAARKGSVCCWLRRSAGLMQAARELAVEPDIATFGGPEMPADEFVKARQLVERHRRVGVVLCME